MDRLKYASVLAAIVAAATLGLGLAGLRIPALVAGGLLLALLGLVIWLAFAQARIDTYLLRENKELKSARKWSDEDVTRLEAQRRRSELSALQFQINPHFLYNTLDTIRGQALLDDRTDIAQMAEKLARFFRYAISNRESLVRVEEEIQHIEDYLFIQKKRFGDRFDTRIDVEAPELNEYYMVKLLLQPLVENAITHGLERLRSGGLVRISVGATEKKLIVCVEDNGVGMPPQTLNALNDKLRAGQLENPGQRRRGNGIAVQNVNARIRMTFGAEYGLHYRSQPGEGTQVIATLPLVDDFERSRLTLAEDLPGPAGGETP